MRLFLLITFILYFMDFAPMDGSYVANSVFSDVIRVADGTDGDLDRAATPAQLVG